MLFAFVNNKLFEFCILGAQADAEQVVLHFHDIFVHDLLYSLKHFVVLDLIYNSREEQYSKYHAHRQVCHCLGLHFI